MHRFTFVLLGGIPALLATGCGAAFSAPASVGSSAVHTVSSSVAPAVSASPVVTTTSSDTTAPSHLGNAVTTVPPGAIASLIPSQYPLQSDPLTFYHPSQYAPRLGIMVKAGSLDATLGLYSGVQNTLLAMVVGNHLVLTKPVFGTLSLLAVENHAAVFHVTSAFSETSHWLEVNLATASLAQGPSLESLGLPALDTQTNKVLGIAPSIPVPTLSPQKVAATSNSPPGLEGTLLYEANRLFGTSVLGPGVTWHQTGAKQIVLTNPRGGNWHRVTFAYQAPHWVPTAVTTDGHGQSLAYQIQYQNGVPYSGILSNVGLFTYPRTLAHGSASIWTSQLGALAKLPIDLDRFAPAPQTLGNPKIVLQNGATTVLALTYDATSNGGQAFYAPTGWYWWTGAPDIYPTHPAPAPTSPASS